MSMAAGPQTTVMVYANNDEAFDLRFRNTAWKLSTGDVPTAELLFDGKHMRLK